MQNSTFIEFIHNICIYFERKLPSEQIMEQWYPEVEFIPSESLTWIAGRIKQLDNFPRNLPGTIKGFWYEWLDANPNKKAREQELGCSGCHGGYIQVSQYDEAMKRYYNTMFRCANCRPKYPKAMALTSIEALLKSGGYFKPLGYLSSWKYADCLSSPQEPVIKTVPVERKSIDQIVQDIEQEMELPF